MTQKTSPGSSEETIGAVLLALEDKDTSRKALQFAKTRCATLRQMGIGADPSDLVQGVIADTLSGDLSWRPEACTLASHLIGAIRSRTHKLRTRSREFLNRNEQPDGPTRHPEPQLLASDVWARIRETLLSRATEAYDNDVSYVLMAFDLRRSQDGSHMSADSIVG